MRSLLPPSAYADAGVFADEIGRVFEPSWHLVGFLSDLREPNDYVTVALNGRAIFLQNFDGELRAFRNVCSHRQSRLRADACGNGPLRCPYHGWTYDAEGVPYSIPNRKQFDSDDLPPARDLRLERFAVATLGSFVFLRSSPQGPELVEYLGDALEQVVAIGEALGDVVSVHHLVMEANWKVVVENTLEAYHLNAVHSSSLKRLGLFGRDFAFQGEHSSWRSPVRQEPSATRERLDRAFATRPFQTEDYIHQLLFPSATLATAQGTSFNVNFIRPVAVNRTEVTVYVCESKLGAEATRMDRALAKALRPSVVELTNTIFDEDKVVCELVQLGLTESSRNGVLGAEEQRVLAFQEAYLLRMEGVAI